MAKSPKHRDPAKHSKKDPAKPTRAKASRPDVPVIDPSLADILNPAIGKGRAGLGAQTGTEAKQSGTALPSPLAGEGWEGGGAENYSTSTDHLSTPTPNPSPQGGGEKEYGGLKPPPDNSWDRRADFANAHRARKSTQGKAQGFEERPQSGYAAKGLTSVDPELADTLGDDTDPTKSLIGNDPAPERDELADIFQSQR